MSELPEHAKKAIEDVRAGRSTVLSLRALKDSPPVDQIPETVFDLDALEELDLAGHSIRIVPERISSLVKLKELNLFHNPIENVPDIRGLMLDWISYLLCRQSLSPGHIVGLNIRMGMRQDQREPVSRPDDLLSAIFELPNLRHLRIGPESVQIYPRLTSLSPDRVILQLIERLDELSQLETLHMRGILLSTLPLTIKQLRSLHALSLIGTGLRKLPGWIAELHDLTNLSLIANKLTELPESLSLLQKLTDIDLSHIVFDRYPTYCSGCQCSRISIYPNSLGNGTE
jgi:Leucine-rich repeat (LRR) protein